MSRVSRQVSMSGMTASSSSRRRNYLLHPHRTDGLIEFIKGLLTHSFVLDSMAVTADATWRHVEELIEEHRELFSKEEARQGLLRGAAPPAASALQQTVPTVSRFFTSLPLRQAWAMYDAKYHVSARRMIQPSFNEIRHVLNLAQVLAMRETGLRLVSFDGDCTLYSDGKDFCDIKLARYITLLLKRHVHVALVTAAGYAYASERYAKRLSGLFAYFEDHQLPADAAARFWVLGGECNYLLVCEAYVADSAAEGAAAEGAAAEGAATEGAPGDGGGGAAAPLRYRLASREEAWRDIWAPDEARCKAMLDVAEGSLKGTVEELHLRGSILRKPRAIGLIPGGREGKAKAPGGSGKSTFAREALDEACLRLQAALKLHCDEANAAAAAECGPPVPPFCAFNGGNDVWADIGNKRVGVAGLSRLLDIRPEEVLHVGDQFDVTGNDFAARNCCPCLWIVSPTETKQVIKHMLRQALQLPNEALKEGKDLPASRAGGAPPSEAAPVRNPSVEQSTGLDAKFGLGEVVHSS